MSQNGTTPERRTSAPIPIPITGRANYNRNRDPFEEDDPEGLGFKAGSGEEYKVALDGYMDPAEVTKQAQQRLVFFKSYNRARWSVKGDSRNFRDSLSTQHSNQSTSSEQNYVPSGSIPLNFNKFYRTGSSTSTTTATEWDSY